MNNNYNKTIILIHPTMSVFLTFDIIHAYGFKILTIATGIDKSKFNVSMLKEKSDFYFDGSLDIKTDYPLIKAFINSNDLDIYAIINGIDSSLYYTDYLVKNLMHNSKLNLEYSTIRLNKYLVNDTISKNNLPTIPSYETSSPQLSDDLISKLDDFGWPIIAKPSENTASMAGFKILDNKEQLKNYLSKNIGQKNSYYHDCIVNKIILQKYIPIKEYNEFVIDFVSYNDQHYLQGIVIYDKETHGTEVIYRTYRPLILDEAPGIAPVIEYVQNALIALKVNYGFTHNEVFWDGQKSFYLIESNNRMAGGGIPDAYQKCYGYTPLDSFLKLIRNDDISNNTPKQKIEHSLCMHLYNFYNQNPSTINVQDIKSFKYIVSFYPKNMAPIDFKNYTRADHITATILLSNPDKDALKDDMAKIVDREKNGSLFL